MCNLHIQWDNPNALTYVFTITLKNWVQILYDYTYATIQAIQWYFHIYAEILLKLGLSNIQRVTP